MSRELTQREKEVLREIIHDFILTANPVASKFIAQKADINLSPATIRHVMAQLEESGYLNHPHTSAGRVPTDKGYRLYLDTLMSLETLQDDERAQIAAGLNSSLDSSELLSDASKLLGKVTKQLSLVSAPYLGDATLTKIELLSLNSSKILVVISLETGLIKTIVLEVESEVGVQRLKRINTLLNERLSGLKLSEIRETISERVGDHTNEDVINRFAMMSDKIFAPLPETDKFHIGMPQGILSHPEFDCRKISKEYWKFLATKMLYSIFLKKSNEMNRLL